MWSCEVRPHKLIDFFAFVWSKLADNFRTRSPPPAVPKKFESSEIKSWLFSVKLYSKRSGAQVFQSAYLSTSSLQKMAVRGLQLACLLATLSLVLCDTYLHHPRGSNNRLNERSANRDNANRLFDSQVSYRSGSSSHFIIRGKALSAVNQTPVDNYNFVCFSPTEQQQRWIQCWRSGHRSIQFRRRHLLHGTLLL